MNDKPLRIFGLDLLRSLAIIFVIIGHSGFLITNHSDFPFIPLPDGVDLFFVLSGYLVGTIIIKITEQHQKFNLVVAFEFLKRRWFRTLPNYFLFLLLNIILVYYGIGDGFLDKYLPSFFVFLQTFNEPHDSFFYESWSLTVEEWFYLLFPLILLVLHGITKHKIKTKNLILIAIAIFLLFPLIYRIHNIGQPLDFNSYYRKLVLTRLDTIAFGFVGAYLNWYHREFWEKSKTSIFIVGITMLIFLISDGIPYALFYKSFYYSFIGLSILCMLPKLVSLKNETIPLKPFLFISKISYAMYLLHLPLLQIISKTIKITTKTESIIVYFIFWLMTILISYVIYKTYEMPIMNLRDNPRKQV